MKTHSASDLSSSKSHILHTLFIILIHSLFYPPNLHPFLVAYKAKLEFLQPSIGKPRFCDKVCEERPICYTDFEPNYNPARKLNKVLLQPAKNDEKHWNRVQFKKDVPGLANQKYGWLDRRPLYESSGFNSSIYVQLQVDQKLCSIGCLFTTSPHLSLSTNRLDITLLR